MPIYEYECAACNSIFERRQRFDEEPIAACPECEGRARRVIHSVPVLFKGSGFYCTDNGRGSKDDSGPKTDDAAEKVGAKSKEGTEPKAEAKVATESKEST
ncbi:MAG: zinc ribbon domain-containing protein [Dehalococcoidia bacterium]